MAISIVSSVQSMARKLVATIRGSSSSSDQVLSNTKKDLESLEKTLRRIQAVLNDAEEREIGDDSVKLWLKELRWVAYDAENVLGEYQYEIRRAEIMSSASAAETSLKRKKREDDQVYELSSVLSRLWIPQKIRAENVLGEYQYEIQPDEITTSATATETPLKRKRHDEITTSASATENSLKRKRQDDQVRFPYMEELVFEDMSAWEEWPGLNSGDFPCLCRLTIRDCNKLRRFPLLPSSLDENLIGQQEVGFPRLDELVLDDIPELQQEWYGAGSGYFPSLRQLTIKHCQKLQGFPTLSSSSSSSSSSLEDLCIESCWSLASLTGLQKLTSLESLKLKRCPNLHISPEEELPSKPQRVEIVDCLGLQEWSNMHQFNCIQKYYGLAELTINDTRKIIKDLGADNLTSLEGLYIQNYQGSHLSPDGWLPPMIQILKVHSCDCLESLSLHRSLLLLTRLAIWDCPSLASFDGLHNLPNLEELSLAYCPILQLLPDRSLPSSLRSLSVRECKELRSLPLLHEKLSSLETLEVSNCPKLTNMAGLHNLSSLKSFIILQCPRLWSRQMNNCHPCLTVCILQIPPR